MGEITLIGSICEVKVGVEVLLYLEEKTSSGVLISIQHCTCACTTTSSNTVPVLTCIMSKTCVILNLNYCKTNNTTNLTDKHIHVTINSKQTTNNQLTTANNKQQKQTTNKSTINNQQLQINDKQTNKQNSGHKNLSGQRSGQPGQNPCRPKTENKPLLYFTVLYSLLLNE